MKTSKIRKYTVCNLLNYLWEFVSQTDVHSARFGAWKSPAFGFPLGDCSLDELKQNAKTKALGQ